MDSRTSCGIVIAGALLAGWIATGQESRQEWRLKRADSPDMVQFTVERWKVGSHWSNSNDVPLSRFRGLTAETFDRGGRVTFEYVQDAGRLICQGDFSWRRGSGTFQFEPNPQFGEELRRLGYIAPDQEQTFTMMMTGMSLEFARGVRDAGLHASTGQLIDLRIHGVSLDYLSEAQQAGYASFSAEDYIDLKIHGVRTEFLRDLKGAGYSLSSSQIVELAIHGVNSGYMRELRDYGLKPQPSDMVQLKIHGVSPTYLKGLKDAGYGVLAVDEITNLKIHGVSLDFIQESKTLGYRFTPDELTNLSIHGVNAAYLRRLRDAGMQNLSAQQVEKLKIHGVD